MRQDPDLLDVEKTLEGNLDAFEGIVRRWQGPLLQLAYRFCHDRGRAEEMAQEAFLAAFQRLGQWRRESAFSTWLFAVATNRYRSAVRRYRPPTLPVEQLAQLAGDLDPAEDADRRQLRRLVRAAVAALPAKYRDALTLFYFHELDVERAAASLRIRPGTLKSLLHRGRRRLEARLAQALPKISAQTVRKERSWTTSSVSSASPSAPEKS